MNRLTGVEVGRGYGFAYAQYMRTEGWRPHFDRGGWVNYREHFDQLNGVSS